MKFNNLVAVLCAIVALCCCRTASAVIVAGDNNQSINGTAGSVPAGFSYWPSVGIYGAGASVYLGNDWAISAAHLNSATTNIGGIVYTIDATQVLTNPNDLSVPLAARGQPTDLQLLHLHIDGTHPAPSVAVPAIASSSPLTSAYLLDVGRGRDRSSAFSQTYNSTFTGSSPAMYTGYALNAGQDMRWGDNLVSSASTVYTAFGAGGTPPYVANFTTNFSQFGGTSSEFQLTPGDSGGGAFRQVGGVWQLSGINIDEGIFANQNPNTSAVFGNVSYMADLSVYRSEIMAIIPEPSSVALAGSAAFFALIAVARRRIRR
ncbi:MAG TPA: hypothetical protein VGJ26_07135 [Pirellulales bacterium]|jgi:hypothetical protein